MRTEPKFLHPGICLALVALAAAVPYLGVLEGPFVFDDQKLVKENELLRVEGGEALDRLTAMFNIASKEWDDREVRENYRPLRFLSYYLDYRLSRRLLGSFPPEDPPTLFFHLQNLLWHVLNSLLVYAVGRRLLKSRAGALILAILFAVHPLQTEAVSYVSGRRDVLSTFFFLASLTFYLGSSPKAPLLWVSLLASPLLFACGFLAKEMVITLPAVVLCLELARRARWEPRRVACHAALWIIALWFIFITLSNERLIADPVGGGGTSTVLTAPRYVMRYLSLLALPVSQSIDYSYDAIPASRSLLDPPTTAISLIAVLIALGAAVWGLVRRRAALAFGILWFLITLTPVLQFVPIPERFAERFAYLPSVGILLLVAALLGRLVDARRRLGWAVAASLCAALLAATVSRNGDWRSRLRIWESAACAQPRSARAHLGYANALKENGRLEEALAEYTRALDILEASPAPASLQRGHALQARMFRGGVYAELGGRDPELLEKAIEDLRAVLASTDTDGTRIESSPKHAVLHQELAVCLLKSGSRGEARKEFLRIIELGTPPGLVARAHYSLGKISIMEENIPAAVEAFHRAVEALPEGDASLYPTMIELADMLANLERDPEGAWEVLVKAAETRPPPEVKVGLLLRMAKILDRKGDIQSCLDKLRRALDIDPDSAPVQVTLAGIEANLGRFEVAEGRFRSVLRRDPRNEEAREGLKIIAAKRRIESTEEVPEEETSRILRGLLSRAKKHADRLEYVAAREVYDQLVRTAGQVGETEIVAMAYCGIAEIEDLLGRPDAARSALEKAEKALPERPETLLELASHHLRYSAERDIARDVYLRYLDALGPGEKPDTEALLNLGSLLEAEDPRRALRYLLEARELGVEDVRGGEAHQLERHLGYVYARLEEWEKSFDSFQLYLKAGGDAAESEREKVIAFLDSVVIPRMIDD